MLLVTFEKKMINESACVDKNTIVLFLRNLDDTCRLRLLTSGVTLPFYKELGTRTQRFEAAWKD